MLTLAASHTASTADPLGRGCVGAASGCREPLKMLAAAPTIELVVEPVGDIRLSGQRLTLRLWARLPLRLLAPLPALSAAGLVLLLPLLLFRHTQPHKGSTSGRACRDSANRTRLALKPTTPQQKLSRRVVP